MKTAVVAMLALAGAACSAAVAAELDLAGTWNLVKADDAKVACPIAVPGGVHSALMKAGLMDDAFWGCNEEKVQWVGRSDWNISRSFDVSADFAAKKEIVLRLEDCDAFATIFVNGQKVGETTDRFQRYEFDVKPFLKAGANTVEGRFRSPELEGDRRRAAKGRAFPMSNMTWAKNQAFVRKPACHGGWDWGPAVEVMGFCGTVKLIATDGPRVEYVYSTQDFNADFTHCTLTVVAELSDGSKVEKKFEIDNPPLWWPNGAGEQKFYVCELEVNGEKIVKRIGLRKLEVLNERTVSKDGKEELSLVFRVNGRRLFMKGANWIPCSAYENEQTPARYRDLLESAKAANMNMLRVWGGGQYEKDVFYDTCDELGILLWHDMMCACAVYPGDDAFLGEIRAELAHQLRRLRDHASIAMWCGDNECLGAVRWFKETRADPDFYRGEWIKRSKLQGELVAKYDPARAYWPSSPCCGPGDFGDGWKEDSKGDMHNWDVWHENAPFAKYYDYHPRFCSEFGYQSFPSMEVAETFATKEQILARGPDFEWHQKNDGGNRRIRENFQRYFREPKDVPSELLLSQFQQAMAIQMAVDAWRSEQPRCMGTLFWQLNDNWPVASWSSIEYGGKWKPLHYLAKRFFEPVHVTLAPDGTVKVVNDTDKAYSGTVRAVFYPFDGGKMEIVDIGEVTSPPGSSVVAGKVAQRADAVLELLYLYTRRFSSLGLEAVNFPVRADYKGDLPKANVKAKIDGFKVTLTTDKPAFWVWMNAKGIRGEFNDNAVTLVPGCPRTFIFKPKDAVTPEAFKAAFSVTHLAELFHPRLAAHAGNEVNPDAIELTPIPRPAEMTLDSDRPVALERVILEVADSAEAKAGAEWLAAHFKEWFGQFAPAVEAGDAAGAELPEDDEAYAVAADGSGVKILARGLKGVRWAAYTLRQLATAKRGTFKTAGYQVPTMKISDKPLLKFRGVHLCAIAPIRVTQIERAIRLAALMKFNYVVLEPWGMYRSARHPWWGWPEGTLDKATIRRLVDVGRDLGITLIPQINMFGHASSARGTAMKHCVLDFNPEYEPLFEPGGWNWCLSNPETQRVLRELIAEMHEDFGNPPFFHIGCDEAQPPTCPECRKVPYGELVCKHITGIAEFIKSLGARTMMWHDMLIDKADPRWKGFVAWGSKTTATLADTLPRDVIVCDWQYSYGDMKEGRKDWPTIGYFKEKGFSVCGAPWRNFNAMKPMADYIAKIDGFGLLETTWNHLRGSDWRDMYVYGSGAAWGTPAVGKAPQFDTSFARALRFVGHDMHVTDKRDTGIYDEEIPLLWWPQW